MSRRSSGARPRAVGILGGTFNPPHLGHLELARHARGELGLDRVVLMPAHTPPHKEAEADPGPAHRMRMTELLVDGADGIGPCALEVDRGGPSYTVDTLDAIHASHPDAELTFIVGADAARTLADWREPKRILELADLAVARRPGFPEQDLRRNLERVRGRPDGAAVGELRFIRMPLVDISSSEARRRAARGEPIDRLVGRAVASYIDEHGLYRGAAGAGS